MHLGVWWNGTNNMRKLGVCLEEIKKYLEKNKTYSRG
jgi:DNA-binding transcriptional MerR regulator